LQDIYAWADLRYQTSADSMPDELDLLFKSTREDMLSALQDDLNTPTALVALGKLMNYMSNIPIPGVEGKYTDGTLAFIESTLGLKVANRPDITDEQKSLIAEREQARDDKDWIKSDKLRNELAGQGIGLRDKPYGAQWYRL
jgi:cysteinyl-tRNA synthetase